MLLSISVVLVTMAAKLFDPIAALGYIGSGFSSRVASAAWFGAVWGVAYELLTFLVSRGTGGTFRPAHALMAAVTFSLAAMAVFGIRRMLKGKPQPPSEAN